MYETADAEWLARCTSRSIINPAQVVRTVLQDAASVAGPVITTEAMVAEKPETKAAMPAGGMGGMGDMDF